ncbi:hypothetical protein QTP70_024785, partial [Hemibagrus guttatus]
KGANTFGCITLGSAECAGPPEAMRLVHGTEKQTFSFKKCSAFQFVKRKVRRWMRNPKVSVEKPQAKAFLSPCPKCQDGQDLWYTHFPTSYACCPYSPGGYYLPHPPSPLCQPCMPGPRDKTKNCKAWARFQPMPQPQPLDALPVPSPEKWEGCVRKGIRRKTFAKLLCGPVRKWKMLSRHHGDGKAKEAEPEGHMVCPWAMSPLLGNPVLMECSICNGPYITYSSEEAWQPRQRTQAMDLYYHGESDPDYGCTSDTNLKKAYDRVPREELWYCMRKSGVAEKYVRVVQDMYERSRTVVRCAVGQTEEFKVEVGLHQGSALSPFLFAIVMDQLSEEVRQESPWTMMFADDIVICSESREQVEENLERWRFALERRGMKVSRSKTEYMCVNEREGSGTIRLQGEEVKKVQEFQYLGSTVQSNGECGKEVEFTSQVAHKAMRSSERLKVMTIQTESSVSAPAMTYSKTRGLVANLSAFMKQRKMGLNDFIQKLATSSYACKHPEVDSILTLTPPQDPELMTSNPSPPPSPSQQINLGPSSNPTAKPSDFNFLKVIGKGSFGKVLLARHRGDDQFYAVKVLQKKAILKKKEEKHIMSERNVLLKNVKHPFLVGLHYSFQTTDKLYFVLDYINGGELFYHLQRERCFLEPRARFYAAEIASALGYLHSLNIVYRDLKPENILLDSQGHIILTDFGLCKENIEPNGTTSTFCGTPEYLAPEVLHKQPYDRSVDWWCLGAVLYEMLYGLPPFYSRNTAEMYDNILNKPLQLKPNISNAARHLLEGLLQKDRTKRLGCTDDFNEIKNHMFFSPINWDDLNAKKLTPPFNPNVTGPNDLRHFDPEFTDEPVPSSIGCSPDSALVTASISDAAEAFLGFSYAPNMDSYL